MLRQGVVEFINRQEDMKVCGEADSIATTQSAVLRCQPDLLLLDLRLGAGDTVELIKALRAQYPALRILVFSQFDETLYAEKVMRAGAAGYVMKEEATEEVLTAIRTVLAGDMYVSRHIAVLVFQKTIEARIHAVVETAPHEHKLSDRELHIFQLLGSNYSTRRIAEELNLSIKTVEAHRENIKHKLGVECASQLIDRAKAWVEKNFQASSATPFSDRP